MISSFLSEGKLLNWLPGFFLKPKSRCSCLRSFVVVIRRADDQQNGYGFRLRPALDTISKQERNNPPPPTHFFSLSLSLGSIVSMMVVVSGSPMSTAEEIV